MAFNTSTDCSPPRFYWELAVRPRISRKTPSKARLRLSTILLNVSLYVCVCVCVFRRVNWRTRLDLGSWEARLMSDWSESSNGRASPKSRQLRIYRGKKFLYDNFARYRVVLFKNIYYIMKLNIKTVYLSFLFWKFNTFTSNNS